MERAANRQKLTIKQAGNVRLHSSIAVGEDGILHVRYYPLAVGLVPLGDVDGAHSAATRLAYDAIGADSVTGRHRTLGTALQETSGVGYPGAVEKPRRPRRRPQQPLDLRTERRGQLAESLQRSPLLLRLQLQELVEE